MPRLTAAALLLIALVASGCSAVPDAGGSGGRDGMARVVSVADGDTIELTRLGKVRLIGVDTPEVYFGAECFGRRASDYTKRVLRPGRQVRYRVGVEPRDRFDRTLAYVWLADGRMFNEMLVRRGYATPLTIAPNDEYAERFDAAAERASDARRGLWQSCEQGGMTALP
jgi:micrococcal nuclease